MYTSIRAELQKARRRHDLIVCLLVPVMALLWCQSAAPTGADELASAYSALFYSLPIINTILMPLAMAILASRLWDVEVKGCTPKLLYTLQSRRSLFAAKAALGLAEIFLIVTLEAAGAPLIGHLQHYTQPYPAAGQAAYLWGCTFAVDCMIFFSELLLTVLLANPLPALCVGILGTLLGLFSAFMPAWVGLAYPSMYSCFYSILIMGKNQGGITCFPTGRAQIPSYRPESVPLRHRWHRTIFSLRSPAGSVPAALPAPVPCALPRLPSYPEPRPSS